MSGKARGGWRKDGGGGSFPFGRRREKKSLRPIALPAQTGAEKRGTHRGSSEGRGSDMLLHWFRLRPEKGNSVHGRR